LLVLIGAALGGVIGLFGGGLAIDLLFGDHMAGFAAFYTTMPLGIVLGAATGWLIGRRVRSP
jgi:hypothetical protein